RTTARHLSPDAGEEDAAARQQGCRRRPGTGDAVKSALDPELLSPAVATLIDEAQRSDRAGRRESARRRYETALYLLRAGEGEAASAIVRRVARSYIDEGQFEAADDCLVAALAIAEVCGDNLDRAHAINLSAQMRVLRGDLDEGERLYASALGYARDANDDHLKAIIS